MKSIEFKLSEAIANSLNGSTGNFSIEVEINDTIIEVSGWYEVDGYCEDDYFNGTGAWVTTNASVCITDLQVYDVNGNETESNIDTNKIERYLEAA